MNVSSIVVKTVPKFLDEVVESVKAYEGCDYHLHDEMGRIVVTVEGEGVAEEMEKLTHIQGIDHVISADMMYAYSEDELERERDKLDKEGGDVPAWLNDPNAQVSDIQYNGDLKKKL